MRHRTGSGKKNRRIFAAAAFGLLLAGGVLFRNAAADHGNGREILKTGQDTELAAQLEGTERNTDSAVQLEGTERNADLAVQSEGTEQNADLAVQAEDAEQTSGNGFQAEDAEPGALQAAADQEYRRILTLSAGELVCARTVREELVDRLFYAAAIDKALLERISGKSYTPNETIQPSELSYLRMLYFGPDENTYVGEMIVNQVIEAEILEIFQKLYENRYPIERMVLVDDYDADDEASMQDNNTSAFHYRTIAGSSRLSNHSYGMAVDVNPKYNPYVKTASDGGNICQPQGSEAYADRSSAFAYKIDKQDLAYRLFTEAGFTWGGDWNSVKDYQHFEK